MTNFKNNWFIYTLTAWILFWAVIIYRDNMLHIKLCEEAGGLYTQGKCIEVVEIDYESDNVVTIINPLPIDLPPIDISLVAETQYLVDNSIKTINIDRGCWHIDDDVLFIYECN